MTRSDIVRRQSGAAPLLVSGRPRRRSRRRAGRGRAACASGRAVARRRRRARRGARPLPAPRGAAVARTSGRRLPRVPVPRLDVRGDGRCVRVPSSAPDCRRRPRRTSRPCTSPSATAWCGCASTSRPRRSPRSPQEDDPAFRRINTPVERWQTSATRMTDNFLDITHFPFVHIGTFGRAQDTLVPKFELRAARRLVLRLPLRGRGQQPTRHARQRAGRPTRSTRAMTIGLQPAVHVRSTIRYETGLEHILLLLLDADRRRHVVLHVRRVAQRRLLGVGRGGHPLRPGDRRRGQADARACPGVLPLDQTALVSVQADKCSVEWRRRLAELLREPP